MQLIGSMTFLKEKVDMLIDTLQNSPMELPHRG